MKDVWKYVMTMNGEQCVMMDGQQMLLTWLVDSWDSRDSVRNF